MAYKYSSTELIKKLFSLLYEYKYHVILTVALIIISTLSLTYAPKVLGSIMGFIEDSVYDHKPFTMASCYYNLAFMTILYIISNVSNYYLKKISYGIGEGISMKLRNELNEKINSLPPKFFRKQYMGNIVSHINLDIGNINSILKTTIISFITNVLMIISIIVITLTVNVELSLLFVGLSVFYVVIINILYIRTRNNFLLHQNELGEMTGFISDFLPNKLMIQSLNRINYFKKHFKFINDKQRSSFYKSTFYTEIFNPFSSLIIYLAQVGLYLYAGYLLYLGRIDVEILSVFLLYVQIFKKSILSLSDLMNNLVKGFASLDRVLKITEYPVEEDSRKVLDKNNVKGEIEFNNITYGNIKDFNLKINEGETINLVGKSSNTLIDLLLTLANPDNGEIRLDGVNINKYNSKSLRSVFGVSLEEDYLLYDTIYENIAYGNENITKEDVKNTCEQIGLDKLIQRIPDKYDTVILEDFQNLSSGEKKLICVARALLNDSKILLLNYPNYLSIDTLKDICKDKTVLLLTPDKNSIDFADKTVEI